MHRGICLHAWICTLHVLMPVKANRGDGGPGFVVKDGCGPPCECWKPNHVLWRAANTRNCKTAPWALFAFSSWLMVFRNLSCFHQQLKYYLINNCMLVDHKNAICIKYNIKSMLFSIFILQFYFMIKILSKD